MPGGLGQGLRRLDRRIDQRAQVERAAPQLEDAAGDARDVEQVVEQARHVRELPVDHPARVRHHGHGRAGPEQPRGIADRRERVAQLVAEGRDELVLAPAGLAQFVLELVSTGDVADHGDPALHLAVADHRGVRGVDPATAERREVHGFLDVEGLAAQGPLQAWPEMLETPGADDVGDRRAAQLPEPTMDPAQVGAVGPDEAVLAIALHDAGGHHSGDQLEFLARTPMSALCLASLAHVQVQPGPGLDLAIRRAQGDASTPDGANRAVDAGEVELPFEVLAGAAAATPAPDRGLHPVRRLAQVRAPIAIGPLLQRLADERQQARAGERDAAVRISAPHSEVEGLADGAIASFAGLERLADRGLLEQRLPQRRLALVDAPHQQQAAGADRHVEEQLDHVLLALAEHHAARCDEQGIAGDEAEQRDRDSGPRPHEPADHADDEVERAERIAVAEHRFDDETQGEACHEQ